MNDPNRSLALAALLAASVADVRMPATKGVASATVGTPAPIRPGWFRIGRNEPCYCGSGLKHKKCCLRKDG